MDSDSTQVHGAYHETLLSITRLVAIGLLSGVTTILIWVLIEPYYNIWAISAAVFAFTTSLIITLDYHRSPRASRQLRSIGLILAIAGLMGYVSHGGISVAAPALFFGITCLVISSNTRFVTSTLLVLSVSILIVNWTTFDQFLIGVAPDQQDKFFGQIVNQWLSAFSLGLASIGCIVLITPMRKLATELYSQFSLRAKLNQTLAIRAQVATEMLFQSLPGVTIQLNQMGLIETASAEAVDLLGSSYKDMVHYSDTTLITLTQLPQIIAQASETGYNYTFVVPWQRHLNPPAAISVSPFKTARGERCVIISIQESRPGTRPSGDALARQQLTQLSFNLALDQHCVLMIRLCSQTHDSDESAHRTLIAFKVQLEHAINEKFKLLVINPVEHTLLTTAPTLSAFESVIRTLKLLQEKFASNNAHLAIGVASGSVESDSIISIYERSQLACRHAKELHLSAYADYSSAELADWNPSERALLKNAIDTSKLELTLVQLTRLKPSVPALSEIKLTLNTPDVGRYHQGELLDAIYHYRLVHELDRLMRQRALAMLRSLKSRLHLTPTVIRIPDDYITNIHKLNQAVVDLSRYDTPCEIIWLRVNEGIATGLSTSHWELIQELRSRGMHFILSDVGRGDTDLRLFCDPLFEMIQFSSQMCVDMDSNPKQQDIIRTFVSLATSLNKKTIIKWQHQDAVFDLLKDFGVDYIDDH